MEVKKKWAKCTTQVTPAQQVTANEEKVKGSFGHIGTTVLDVC
jgi:hypothetical protein